MIAERTQKAIPGVGPIKALVFATIATVVSVFRRRRDFAACVGVVTTPALLGPQGAIGAGHESRSDNIRRLLTIGAMSRLNRLERSRVRTVRGWRRCWQGNRVCWRGSLWSTKWRT
ncbi:transposase [Yangia mangrovi]|uniref:Transposase n=1 Tax=Alloyangia mangrovi TaxID=1779329 RepID=A0ABT2KQ67_9RHOB|nr:transposase [Alloyangia mangrovi]